jgi:hypothetical protein
MTESTSERAGRNGASAAAATRAQILALTSAARHALDQRAAGAAPDGVGAAITALVTASAGSGLSFLERSCAALQCAANVGATAGDGLQRALGVVERVLDGSLSGMDPDRLERLCHGDGARELGIGADDAVCTATGSGADQQAVGGAVPARPADEQAVFDAFALEALDALDRCEDALLASELDGRATSVADDIATLCDAAAAVGVVLDPPAPAEATDALLAWIDLARESIELAWGDAPAAAVDPAALLPFDELVLRLRRVARDVARDHGMLIGLDADGGEVRISAAVADRIYEPLAQLVRQAAAHGSADPSRPLRLRIEQDGSRLSVTLHQTGADDDGDRPETLHWIDARDDAATSAAERLAYRPDCLNIVQIVTG